MGSSLLALAKSIIILFLYAKANIIGLRQHLSGSRSQFELDLASREIEVESLCSSFTPILLDGINKLRLFLAGSNGGTATVEVI